MWKTPLIYGHWWFHVRKLQRELIQKVLKKRAPFDRRSLSPLFAIFSENSHMEPTQKVAKRKGSIPESIINSLHVKVSGCHPVIWQMDLGFNLKSALGWPIGSTLHLGLLDLKINALTGVLHKPWLKRMNLNYFWDGISETLYNCMTYICACRIPV